MISLNNCVVTGKTATAGACFELSGAVHHDISLRDVHSVLAEDLSGECEM